MEIIEEIVTKVFELLRFLKKREIVALQLEYLINVNVAASALS